MKHILKLCFCREYLSKLYTIFILKIEQNNRTRLSRQDNILSTQKKSS